MFNFASYADRYSSYCNYYTRGPRASPK